MDAIDFFTHPQSSRQKQYEALRAFYVGNQSASVVAQRFGYTVSSFYSLTRTFRQHLEREEAQHYYFVTESSGAKPKFSGTNTEQLIIELRKKSLSVADIKSILDALGHSISQRSISRILAQAGFERLPRRTKQERQTTANMSGLSAPITTMLRYAPDSFSSRNGVGLLCLLPFLEEYGINQLIDSSEYPETERLSRRCSILSFVALKLSNISRYSVDNSWCMDRGLGFFAGLNVLPKAAWCTSYSHRVTREMNQRFLKGLHQCWQQHNLLGNSANLDFVSIPYWGDDSHLENNWSGSRNLSLPSILSVLAQDPDSGIITYGDTTIRHDNQSEVVMEFLDFYQENDPNNTLKYLVFDSKFTTYKNLRNLEDSPNKIKFITVRKRGPKILEELKTISKSEWTSIRVMAANGKGRAIQFYEQRVVLKDYGKDIRQIAIKGSRRVQPALIITNDFEKPAKEIIHTYARRWLVETEISEQIYFFHLNRVCSSMVIKVDFDLTMSIFAHNIYRLLAAELPGFSHQAAASLFNKFMDNGGKVIVDDERVNIILNKKRNMPVLLQAMEKFQDKPLTSINNLKFQVSVDSTS
ncbi:MAG: transposase [Cyanobacteria bacterium P01_F01_bin.150]